MLHANICRNDIHEEEILIRTAEVASRSRTDRNKEEQARTEFERNGYTHQVNFDQAQRTQTRDALLYYINNNAYSACSSCR